MIKKIINKIVYFVKKSQYGSYGKGSKIINPLMINNKKNIFLGDHVQIRGLARIEPVTEWKGKKNDPKIIIEDRVSIEQGVHITCASQVKIGKKTTLSGYVMITDINHEYKEIGKHILDQELIVEETEIGENCFIGMGARIMAGTTLGKQCIVGTNAVVSGKIPDYSVVVGIPAKIIKRYNISTKTWERTDKKGEFLNESRDYNSLI